MPLDDLKNGGVVNDDIALDTIDIQDPSNRVESQKLGLPYDQRDMTRMGKRQEMRRTFQFFSIWGYAVILGNTWEFALVTGILSLSEGGPAGAIWMFLVTCFGMFFVMLSMAEMASIAPTAGGQYHWVSEFAPPQHQKFLSFTVGWLGVLGWQASMVTVALIGAQQFVALISLSNPNYVIQGWHTALLTIAVTCFSIIFNTVFVRKLPLLEGSFMLLHFFGFLAVFVILWAMGPRSDAHETFTDFEDLAGWGNVGLACLVGISSPVITLVGADSSCHLSEELKNAAWVLPRAMVATALTNYVLAFLMTVILMFNLGNVDDALASPTGQPYVYVLQNATQSHAATCVLTAVVAVLLVSCGINQVTTSSRQLFAFARDGGLPASKFLSRVRPGWDIPLNAVVVTLIVSAVLSLIVIGSPAALSNLTTLGLTGLISSYLIAVACIFAKRLRKEPFPASRFNLGRFGYVANGIALCWLSLAFAMMFFPTAPHPEPASMNWSILIFGVVVVFAWTYYYFRARYRYQGPVEYVRKDL